MLAPGKVLEMRRIRKKPGNLRLGDVKVARATFRLNREDSFSPRERQLRYCWKGEGISPLPGPRSGGPLHQGHVSPTPVLARGLAPSSRTRGKHYVQNLRAVANEPTRCLRDIRVGYSTNHGRLCGKMWPGGFH